MSLERRSHLHLVLLLLFHVLLYFQQGVLSMFLSMRIVKLNFTITANYT